MTDLDKARAYLDTRDVSDEQRAVEAKKRAILGSLDDTYALNRYESDRGAASLLAVCACLLVAISFAPDWWQRCFIAALFAFGIGCWVMARSAQRGAAIRDRLDAEAPKRWDA